MNNKKCVNVVFTAKAYRAIVAETYERPRTETGGVFLGKIIDNVWYVLETIDPGPNAIFQAAYFEYDTPYVNHLANKTARFYLNGLDLLGLWHRHPGSMDTFSSTDDMTNQRYARMLNGGALSGIVNLDPIFRFTLYHISVPIAYANTAYSVDDSRIPQDLLLQKSVADFSPVRQTFSDRSIAAAPLNKAPAQPGALRPSHRGTSVLGAKVESLGRASDHIAAERSEAATPILSPVSPVGLAVQEALLEMLDAEMGYLEDQVDYEFRMVMKPEGLVVNLQYVGQMKEYPESLAFCFNVDPNNGEKLLKINGEPYPYASGIVQNAIAQAVRKKEQRSRSKPL